MDRLPFKLPTFVTAFWREAQEDDIGGLASELAFKLTLAIFPLMIFLASLSAYIVRWSGTDDPAGRLTELIGSTLPSDASSVLQRELDRAISGSNPALLSFGLVATLWPASGAARALMKAVNRVNDLPESRPGWKRTGLSLVITVLGGLTLIAAITALVLSDIFAANVAGWFGLTSQWAWLTRFLRYPLLLAFVILAAQMLFWLAPDSREPFRFWSRGAVLFGIAWAVFATGFSFYVSHIANYGATYGGLAGVIVFLVWLYLSCWILLAAAEVNWLFDTPRESRTPAESGLQAERSATRAEDPRGSKSTRLGESKG